MSASFKINVGQDIEIVRAKTFSDLTTVWPQGGGGGGGENLTPGQRLWLDAGAGFSIDGNDVVTWADQSGNGKNFTGASVTLQENYINGYPAVYFNGVDSYLQAPTNLMNSFAELSIIAVWKVTIGENHGIFGTSGYSDVELTSDPVIRIRQGNYSGNFVFQRGNTSNLWFDDGTWCISSLVAENASGQIFKNGVELTEEGVIIPETIQLPTRNNIIYRMGQYAWPMYSLFSEFYLAEFYIYNKRLTATEREAIEATLNAKYDIFA